MVEDEIQRVTTELITNRFRKMFDLLYENNRIHNVYYRDNFAVRREVKLEEGADKGKIIPGNPPAKVYDFGLKPKYIVGKNPLDRITHYREYYMTFGDFLDCYFKILGDGLGDTLSYTKKQLEDEKNKKIKDTITAHAKEIKNLREKLKRFTVLMCDFKYALKTENKGKKVERTTNVADVPISIDGLYTIVYNEMISTRKFWLDFNGFLTGIAMRLLGRSFGELPSADFLKDVDFVLTNFVGKPCSSKIKKGVLKLQDLPHPLGQVSKKTLQDATEFFIIHQKPPTWTKAVGSGNKKKDLDRGIFHLRASQDRGLIKSINFSKISQPARETYMIFRNGQMYDELRYPHNATVEMFGNNLFMPMSIAYINPDTLGFGDPRGENSIARRLGFGGYYVAERVTTTFSGGQLKTVVQFLFNAFPELPGQDNLSASIKRSIKELER